MCISQLATQAESANNVELPRAGCVKFSRSRQAHWTVSDVSLTVPGALEEYRRKTSGNQSADTGEQSTKRPAWYLVAMLVATEAFVPAVCNSCTKSSSAATVADRVHLWKRGRCHGRAGHYVCGLGVPGGPARASRSLCLLNGSRGIARPPRWTGDRKTPLDSLSTGAAP